MAYKTIAKKTQQIKKILELGQIIINRARFRKTLLRASILNF